MGVMNATYALYKHYGRIGLSLPKQYELQSWNSLTA
jgi:hypothetical protein